MLKQSLSFSMENLFKSVFCLMFMFTLTNSVFAQREIDSTKTEKDIYVIKTDADLVEEITSDDGKAIILKKSTGEIYTKKPEVKEKRFISVDSDGKEND